MNYYTILNAANRLALTCGFTIKSQKPQHSISPAPVRHYYLVNSDNQVVPIRLDTELRVFTLQELLAWFSGYDNADIACSAKALLSDLLSEHYQQVIEVKCRLPVKSALRAY
jgi:hypothetical protein